MNNKVIVCDLDGTLAPSKSFLQSDMAETIINLLETHRMVVVTGGTFKQIETQFISHLPKEPKYLNNLFLFPTNGSTCYVYDNNLNNFVELYSEELSIDEKDRIISALNFAIKDSGIDFSSPYGDLIEDRGSQISLSGRGQLAPLDIKSKWDPDQAKRKRIIEILNNYISDFEIRIGGATTIDITRKGVNKAYAISKIIEILKTNKEDIVFIGDALYEGGNDSTVISTGVRCISVSGPEQTIEILRDFK